MLFIILPYDFVDSAVMSPLWFLILVNFFFSFIPVILARGLSTLSMLSKNQLLVSLAFFFFLFSIAGVNKLFLCFRLCGPQFLMLSAKGGVVCCANQTIYKTGPRARLNSLHEGSCSVPWLLLWSSFFPFFYLLWVSFALLFLVI